MTPTGAYRHAHAAQGPFFHPKDAMRHNVDISGAWTTFVLDPHICLGNLRGAGPDAVEYSQDRDGI